MQKSQQIAAFAGAMWDWFARHKRTLPWRDLKIKDDARRAYLVLVSEIMLQQTQVPRVEVVYKRFIREFPLLKGLAAASNRDVLLAWRGMGYNSRALRLRDAARKIFKNYPRTGRRNNEVTNQREMVREFPASMEELRKIPGVGPYTAAAIRNFAFNLPTPCIDTNIRRILHRVFTGPEKRDGTWKKNDQQLLKVAGEVLTVALDFTRTKKRSNELTKKRTADWHAALMDFGSLVCTKNAPRCSLCPLKGLCAAAGKVPVVKKKMKKEPGREIAGKFVPDRIIRGRIVEELRDAERGLSFGDIGARVCIDWDPGEHRVWLSNILSKLTTDGMIAGKKAGYRLAD